MHPNTYNIYVVHVLVYNQTWMSTRSTTTMRRYNLLCSVRFMASHGQPWPAMASLDHKAREIIRK